MAYDLVIRNGTVVTAADSFRADVLSRIGAWALSHPDEDPAYDEIFPDYFAQMREDYYKKQKEVVGKSINRMLGLLANRGERLTTEEVSLTKTEEQNATHALEVLLGEHDGDVRRDRHTRLVAITTQHEARAER